MNAHIMLPFPHGSTTTQSKISIVMICILVFGNTVLFHQHFQNCLCGLCGNPYGRRFKNTRSRVLNCSDVPIWEWALTFLPLKFVRIQNYSLEVCHDTIIQINYYQLFNKNPVGTSLIWRREMASFSRKSNCCRVEIDTNIDVDMIHHESHEIVFKSKMFVPFQAISSFFNLHEICGILRLIYSWKMTLCTCI